MNTQVINTTELATIIAALTPVDTTGLTERSAVIKTNAAVRAAKASVQLVLDTNQAELAKGNVVNLNGFGKFEVKDTEARTGRNPSSGEALEIAASKRLSFKTSTALKAAIKG